MKRELVSECRIPEFAELMVERDGTGFQERRDLGEVINNALHYYAWEWSLILDLNVPGWNGIGRSRTEFGGEGSQTEFGGRESDKGRRRRGLHCRVKTESRGRQGKARIEEEWKG